MSLLFVNMPFSKEDRNLIKNLYLLKGISAQKLKEFRVRIGMSKVFGVAKNSS